MKGCKKEAFLVRFYYWGAQIPQSKIDGQNNSEKCQVTALGFVCKILWGTSITLDGDGGFR